jgi:hypothetical protein
MKNEKNNPPKIGSFLRLYFGEVIVDAVDPDGTVWASDQEGNDYCIEVGDEYDKGYLPPIYCTATSRVMRPSTRPKTRPAARDRFPK